VEANARISRYLAISFRLLYFYVVPFLLSCLLSIENLTHTADRFAINGISRRWSLIINEYDEVTVDKVNFREIEPQRSIAKLSVIDTGNRESIPLMLISFNSYFAICCFLREDHSAKTIVFTVSFNFDLKVET